VSGFDLPFVENAEYLHSVLLPVLFRCGVAAVCGGLIGLEREFKGKPAGLRTNILICVGAAIYMVIGMVIVHAGGERTSDVARIGAQVVTGIGFLGAGCILRRGEHVTGLTSAATIWVVAAIGIVAGAGFAITALFAAVMVLLTLVALGWVEVRVLDPLHERRGHPPHSRS
jgi:putative Mg2+ transporter-C (MgtC) family protein